MQQVEGSGETEGGGVDAFPRPNGVGSGSARPTVRVRALKHGQALQVHAVRGQGVQAFKQARIPARR